MSRMLRLSLWKRLFTRRSSMLRRQSRVDGTTTDWRFNFRKYNNTIQRGTAARAAQIGQLSDVFSWIGQPLPMGKVLVFYRSMADESFELGSICFL